MTLSEKLLSLKSTTPKLAIQIEALFVKVDFKKKSILNTSDHTYPIIYFIEEGLVRKYFIYEQKEYTSYLMENGFLLPLAGFFTQEHTIEYIEFLENTSGWSLNLSKAEVLAKKEPLTYRILLEIYEESLHSGKHMELMLRLKTGYERLIFLEKKGLTIVYNVFNYTAASYLDVTEKHLSFLKRKATKARSIKKINDNSLK